ncbi:hypothetical protein AD953_13110 [Acetobacter malorum]|uniref:IrrE N-terminal-like domain-containing protein n=1 Tax=Acetobacter malorum TaxID=178901 RepID=A0A149V1U1_9PROT|nr:ImmA/IrrE family metallo-endopeptidase [Acetobacter malorum]KXV74122.1 hypothetical protein AD953_13110 [Acetobacter malorum]
MTQLAFFLSDPIDPKAPTFVGFRVVLDGEGLWPLETNDVNIDIFIDDILDYLTDFWGSLLLEQTYPLEFDEQPSRPSDLYAKAASRWINFSENQIENEQSLVSAFEEAHNLPLCFDGQFGLPPLWILREHNNMLIDTGEKLVRINFEDTVSALVQLGDEIATRLEKANIKSSLVAAWRSRDNISGIRMVELRVGLSEQKAEELVKTKYLIMPNTIFEAMNDNNELVIAARMAGALSVEEIKRIINLAKSFPCRPSKLLADLAMDVRSIMSNKKVIMPFDQGELAARIVREKCRIDTDEVLDIDTLVHSLGIEVKKISISLTGMMGLAISGSMHGPGILLNKKCDHFKYAREAAREAMLRYTLAHELCHLLVDGEHSFAAVDVLRGRMSPAIESRAQSFAGELLLPTRLARSVWEAHKRPTTSTELNTVVEEAVQNYNVTRSVAAWKIEHAARESDVDLHQVLRQLAPYR